MQKVGPRTFAPFNRTYQDINYYIEPNIVTEGLWLEDKHDKKVYIITFSSGIVVDKGLEAFWYSVCTKLQCLGANRFNFDEHAQASSSTFASYLVGNKKIIERFISLLRVLKDGRDKHDIYPFTQAEIAELLNQYSEENNFELDIYQIAEDIYSLTLGHKGLVGLCCSYLETKIMEGKIKLTIDGWNEVTFRLPEFIRGKATYEFIIRALHSLSEKRKKILARVLCYKTDVVSRDDPDVKFLLAEGMIVVKRKLGSEDVLIQCAAPILCNIMLYQITGPNIDLSKSSKPDKVQTIAAKWMLERTIENLSIKHIFTDKTSNSGGEPSEYAFQAEFNIVMKNLLQRPIQNFFTVFFLRDSMWLEANGFELVFEASRKTFNDHCTRAKKYADLHNCSMLMVNLCTNKTLINYFGPDYENVTAVHVVYGESKGCAELAIRIEK
ncbi:1578_t:CDS:2 [Ambispora gerdemannii]|uniref:1578_t:CDS:1 n=1 Tax=Ambispora gerdemannii TaxID=144530 RepID=A0A9N8Z311_9GLOM|nr:1578_t:CDS:2 [Ambispora gerdemannii]